MTQDGQYPPSRLLSFPRTLRTCVEDLNFRQDGRVEQRVVPRAELSIARHNAAAAIENEIRAEESTICSRARPLNYVNQDVNSALPGTKRYFREDLARGRNGSLRGFPGSALPHDQTDGLTECFVE
jgi:hypothetical protein